MDVITAPEKVRFLNIPRPALFLAGSIDQGDTPDWQSECVEKFKHIDITFLNPRRANWDKQADEAEVRSQIEWELHALGGADAIFIYFHPKSLAPISLLELGLFAHHKNIIVVCPNGFWRRTNVQVVCEQFSIPVFEDFDEGLQAAVAKAIFNFKGAA